MTEVPEHLRKRAEEARAKAAAAKAAADAPAEAPAEAEPERNPFAPEANAGSPGAKETRNPFAEDAGSALGGASAFGAGEEPAEPSQETSQEPPKASAPLLDLRKALAPRSLLIYLGSHDSDS